MAILPLDGPFGDQEADYLSVEFAENGIATVERAKVAPLVAVDVGLRDKQPVSAVQNYAKYAEALGVRYLFVGTTSAERAALYSFPHADITLRLIDTRTGQTRWIGRYGNSLWSSAVSTQGDLKLGARNLVKEFVRAGGDKLLSQ
jgi:TolB-like protein